MQYNLKEMIEIQKELNNKIYTTQKIDADKIRNQSHLCILIELMELCNETRCFNYWSKKTRGTDQAILEEFADVLCFLLSEMLDLQVVEITIDDTIKPEDKLQLTNRFADLANKFSLLNKNNPQTYVIFIQELFNLGYALGYNIDQMLEGYKRKVAINHQIQNSFNQ